MSGFDLERFRAGDAALFADLIRDHSPRLLPYLRRYVRPDLDAEDLLQEVWLRAYRKRQTFEARGSFFGWLLAIGRTVGMSSVAGRDPPAPQTAATAAPADAEGALLRDAVRSAVLRLPERQRDVVLLRLVEGLSTAETAARLGCAQGTVKATLHQATRRLRELLKEEVR